jgi:propionyl-CoA carboxylase alpha chain
VSDTVEVRPIRKLLVANRGEIARRVVRAARSLGIATVAVFSDADAASPHVREADEAVRLPGSAASETSLVLSSIVEAAVRTGADALHPGYGFLSENPDLARACAAAGVVFVGPGAEAIEQMGSKLAAKAIVGGSGVPVLAGRDASQLEGDKLAAAAAEVGWPLLVKASAGGGGRGMRIVRRAEDLVEAVEGARREAASAFGDATVFLERYLEGAHHVEIQVVADAQGTTVHLGERDCSVQRRHQKIIEEAPSPVVGPELRQAMGAAAVAAARSVGYRGVGTVEFLVDREGGFWFLEMNTRLQVEHPVTEAVTGIDLVELQLRVAEGRPLPAEVVGAAAAFAERGVHAIEARLYAEDPEREFLPSTGVLRRFSVGDGPGLRVDAGVEDGSVVSSYYDPLLAKVIAWAPTRDEARRRLAAALASARAHGLRTNRDLLVAVLLDGEFAAGAADVQFLERRPAAELSRSRHDPAAVRLHAVGAALAEQAARRAGAGVLAPVASGWRNNPSQPQVVRYEVGGGGPADPVPLEVTYFFDRAGVTVGVDGDRLEDFQLVAASPERVECELGGVRRSLEVTISGHDVDVGSPLGSTSFRRLPRFPVPHVELAEGSLVAPMPGVVARVAVAAGEAVDAGQVVVVVESMKMEHPVRAPAGGRVVELRVAAGHQVDSGTVLAVVEAT